MMIPILLACTPPDGGPRASPSDGAPSVETSPSEPTGSTPSTTGSTGDTGSTPATPPPDCTNLPDGSSPVPYTVLDIWTTEDFDFDALGKLVLSNGDAFGAIDLSLDMEVFAPAVPDTRGIQVLSNGDVVAAFIFNGTLGYTERLTGAGSPLVTGLAAPNALEIGDGDEIFVTEVGLIPARVRSWDLATLTPTDVATGFGYPNGLVLSPAQDVLYVSDMDDGIYAVPRDPDGSWGDKELLFAPDPGERFDALEVDACGNVYSVGFTDGRLYRFDPVTKQRVLLLDIDDPSAFWYNAVRWGSDRGGWRRDVLYVTNRHKVFAVEVGIRGPRQPVDAMP